jgi:transcriptional regulator GlxA family with amidase domain
VTPLLRELVVEAVRLGQLRLRNPEHCALRDLIVLNISRANSVPTHVRLPQDSRALTIALQIIDQPADLQPVRRLCAQAGIGLRTLQRIFVNDVGVDLNTWRRQVRLTKAIELLVAGGSVKQVAFSVGYRQPSAFVSAFHRTFGASPKAWVDRLQNI